ncbi:MAG: twin-arginine translocase TatA/TatE family subunit [Gemmatimonadota bacterium]
MFSGIGMWELIFLFVIVLLLFGAKRLPEIGASLGKGIREFKGSLREIEGELKLPPEQEKGRPQQAQPQARAKEAEEEGGNGGEPRRLTTSQ